MSVKGMGIKKKNLFVKKTETNKFAAFILKSIKNDKKGKINFNDRSHCLDVPGV
jgi:hypothetical protein